MSDIVKTYNPANAAALTSEQLAGLQQLTSAQIKELALAYPNGTMGSRAYLLIIDSNKPAGKQIPTLSTFENLYNIRERNGLRSFVALGFKGNTPVRNIQPSKLRKSEVLDLSDTELLSLPGFKTGKGTVKEETIPAQEVPVTRVRTKKAATKKANKKN